MNGRGTWDNIRLVVTSLVLLYHNYITPDEIRLAIDAYTLQCREPEKKREYLELSFDQVNKALRVSYCYSDFFNKLIQSKILHANLFFMFQLMGKAISETIFKAWVKRMEPFLLCYDKDRLAHFFELAKKEKAYEDTKHMSFSGGADDNPMGGESNTLSKRTSLKATKGGKKGGK